MDAAQQPEHSWFGTTLGEVLADPAEESSEFVRLWQAFMTARLTLGTVLALLQAALFATGTTHNKLVVGISFVYFAGALTARLFVKPHPLGQGFSGKWFFLVGLDVLAFLSLQALQGSSINYTPLCVLPILLTSVLGTIRLALGTAAGITVLLLGGTLWAYLEAPGDATPYLVQSALSGAGYFVIALLANQLSTRLAREGQRARSSQLAARVQRQVNELVIESLPDGVLVVDDKGCVRAANPAARQLLGTQRARESLVFFLKEEPGWLPLLDLTRLSIGSGINQAEDVNIRHEGHGACRVRARTRLTPTHGTEGEALCVLFLQDLRELEARMRTDKLASMGRMSTAVAHEIRNPLAAISQANALLDEDLVDPRQKKLTAMVSQNAKRLDRIVDDILKVSRLHPEALPQAHTALALDEWAQQVCRDWSVQNGCEQRLQLMLGAGSQEVVFEADHLRRVLVNLLDNALRYVPDEPASIRVSSLVIDDQQVTLSVWSHGKPMEQSVERHLFEPFFSSESRSTGLGLYICRELCERYGASIVYQRRALAPELGGLDGNEFAITLLPAEAQQRSHLQRVSASL